jgi:hypothetical protein
MDELNLLKKMADRTPLPSREKLAPARARLLAESTAVGAPVAADTSVTAGTPSSVSASTAAGAPGTALTTTATAATTAGGVNGHAVPVPTARRRWGGRRRLMVSGVAIVGLAAAITGVVALGGLEPVGVAPAKASAAEVLHQAAEATRQLPDSPPRPDQFIYTRSQNGDGSIREAWLSADGTRDGLIAQQGDRIPLPGCRDGQAPVIKGTEALPGMFEPCTPTPAYQQDLPTTAAGMREFLSQDTGGEPGQPEAVDKLIHDAFAETYTPPAALAALFEAIADFPGLTLDENATDGAGRPGLGVSWTRLGHTTTLIFDRTTHAFLGVAGGTAVVAQAIVDEPGQLP